MELTTGCLPNFETSSSLDFRTINSLKQIQARADTMIQELPDLSDVQDLDNFGKTMTDSYFTALATDALKDYLQEKQLDWEIRPTNCWANNKYPFFTAQPDALLLYKGSDILMATLEIKTFSEDLPSYTEAEDQIQRTLCIMEAPRCFYFVYNRTKKQIAMCKMINRDPGRFDFHAQSVRCLKIALARKLQLENESTITQEEAERILAFSLVFSSK